MVLLLFVTQACTDIFLSGLPEISKEFGASTSVTNLTLSIYNYSLAFFVLFIGVISDFFGRKKTILACLFLHILASGAIGFSHLMPLIIVMRIFQALGGAAAYIIFRLIIKDTLSKDQQIHAVGQLVFAMVLSPMVAPTFGAFLISYFSWRACFLAIALIELPLFFWALFAIKETRHETIKNASFLKSHLSSYISILKNSYFLSCALIVGATFAAFYSFIGISSYLYINEYQTKHTTYSYVFIALAAAYLIGNRMMNQMNEQHLATRKMVRKGVDIELLGAIMIFLAPFFENVIIILGLITLGTCVLRFSTALINPPIQVEITNYFEEKGAYALGLLTSFQYTFAAFATSLVSDLPLRPSHSLIVSTSLFVFLSFIGYFFYSKNKAARA